MPEENGNGRLLAVLDERTKNIDDFIRDYIKRNDESVDDHEKRLRCVETEQTRVAERLSVANQRQALYTTIAGIMAAVFGKVT